MGLVMPMRSPCRRLEHRDIWFVAGKGWRSIGQSVGFEEGSRPSRRVVLCMKRRWRKVRHLSPGCWAERASPGGPDGDSRSAVGLRIGIAQRQGNADRRQVAFDLMTL